MKSEKLDNPILSFHTQADFEKWLEKNHDSSMGVWIQLFNKASGLPTITHAEALDVALCYGWIDSLARKYNSDSHIQRFSPRKPKGLWSKRNREHIQRLIDENKMKAPGLAQVAAAKADGRWDAAYDAPSEMVIPKEFMIALAKNKKADQFFKTLNKSNTYAIGWRVQTAKKEETKQKRIKLIIEMLSRGEKFH